MKLEMNKRTRGWTAGQGHMPKGTTYQQLVEVFGEPNGDVAENFKIDVEWIGILNDEVFTIYNYKTGHSYLEAKGKDVEQLVGDNWHIGGCDKGIAEKVIEYFERKVQE